MDGDNSDIQKTVEGVIDPAMRRKRRRRLWYSFRGILLILALPFVCLLLLPVLLIGQEVTAPGWIKTEVEEQAASVLGGGSLTFGDMTITVETDLHPTVRLRDAVLRDADDVQLARVPQIDILLSPRGLILNQEVLPQEIQLRGTELSLRRARDGSVALAFETSGAPAATGRGLVDVLEEVDAALDLPALAALEQVQADGVILNFDDARAGRSWVVDGGRIALGLTEERTRISGDFTLLSGRSYVTTLTLGFESPRGSPAAQVSLGIVDIPAVDIATQNPALQWLSVLDAPVSAQMRASLDDTGQLGPFFATLEIGAGALQPNPAATPIGFDAAKAYLEFDPDGQAIRFDQVEISSDWGEMRAEGRAYLRDLEEGLPQTLLGQFQVIEMRLNPRGLYPEALDLRQASADLRLRFDPFVADIGYFGVTQGRGDAAVRLEASGQVRATPEGWAGSLSAGVESLVPAQMMALWPEGSIPRSRRWFETNWLSGEIHNVLAGIRVDPVDGVDWAITHEFRDAAVQVMRQLPPVQDSAGTVTLMDGGLTVVVDAGRMTAPVGGTLDVAGSVFHIPRMGIPEAPAEITLHTESSVTAALSVLDEPPFRFLSRAGLPVDLAQGRAVIDGVIALPLMRNAPRERIDFAFDAVLSGVRTSQLIPGRNLGATRLTVRVEEAGMEIAGPVAMGDADGAVRWSQTFGAGASDLSARVTIDQGFLDEMNIALPPGMVSGSGQGDLSVRLVRDQAPSFVLRSDLRGIGLSLPALGWSKGRNSGGTLVIEGVLGQTPRIDRLVLEAAGLRLEGDVRLQAGGGLDRARFSTVELGGWLTAAVELRGRGNGRPVAVVLNGGSLDLRRANFGQGGGQSGPMEIRLDRLQVTDSIVLRDFRGVFDGGQGLSGEFSARLGGEADIQGTLIPVGGRVGVRVISANAGAVLAAANVFETARGGSLDLTLQPAGGAGSYDGVLAVTNLRVRDAPALASLLDAISVVGLLQQLDGQGLSFSNVDANFRLTPTQIIVTQASAVGPGLGISIDGVYTLAGKVMDFQGVVSPLYLINGVGAVLTRPGEGLFGFNFTLRGPAEQASVGVNPLSVLTPGMFRDIFRRPVPVVE